MYHQKERRRHQTRNLWLWFVCCSLLPTCYFHRPFTSGADEQDLEVRKPNNIPANNRRANGHSHGSQRKRTWWTTRRTSGEYFMKLLSSFIIQLLGHRCWPGVFRDLRSFQCCVPSDWLFSCRVFDSWERGPQKASTTKYKTDWFRFSASLHVKPWLWTCLCEWRSFKWIQVNRFRAAHNKMWHVTVNCASLTSTS